MILLVRRGNVKKRSFKRLRKIEQVSRLSGRLIVFDLEATCWEPEEPERVEILEIGAVEIAPASAAQREFAEIVRPVRTPLLSDFCLSLVPIRQEDADAADPFPVIYRRFVQWAGDAPFWLGSWGSFDRRQLLAECRRHRLAPPPGLIGHIDLRREFARWKQVRPAGLKAALELAGLSCEGRAHRALDDSRNLARLSRILLATLRQVHPGGNDAHDGTGSAV